jgi:hypothetical protein
MRFSRSQKGLILIELVTTLILIGIIGGFTVFFLYTGIRGFLTSKFSSESALQAQIALDRIGSELRYIRYLEPIPVQTPNPNPNSIEYRSRDLPGARRINYNSANQEILLTVNGTSNVLLNNVSAFNLSWVAKDLDGSADGNDEIAQLRIGFTIRSTTTENETPFSAEIYPRSMLPVPP